MAIFNYNGLQIDTDALTEEEMPNSIFRDIFTLCGADVAVSLLIYMRGNTIQVPTKGFDNIERKIIVGAYNELPTTDTIRLIARKFGITEGYIRQVLKNNKIDAPSEGQIPFLTPSDFKSQKESV